MIGWQLKRHTILIEGERQSAQAMTQNRLSILAACFVVFYCVVAMRLVDLTVVQGFDRASQENVQLPDSKVGALVKRRGDVYDRHGFLVATSLKVPVLFADPSLVIDPKSLSQKLVRVFPALDRAVVLKVLSAKNEYGVIKHEITPAQQQAVLDIGDPGLGFKYRYKRVYPQGSLFSHMLGYSNRDGTGLSGVERGYDDVLARGEDVRLSIDLRLQHLVKREVARAISDFDAKAGTGVIMDAKTGEILAGVSLPDFDLNQVETMTGKAADNKKFNRLTLGVYELGSMFKIFSTAALLDLRDVPMGYTFDARKPIKVGWHTINDYHAQKRIMTVPEVFMHSSNIGSALMGKKVGNDALYNFYDDLGLLSPLRFEVKEVGMPLVPKAPWRDDTTMTVSYGHGLSTTPLQMSAAVASVVNGGYSVRPTMIKQEKSSETAVRVISESTSDKMRKLLRLVVTKGTGKNADVKGYMIGGKTGTAEKVVDGRYDSKKLISSIVGAFPMNDPRYVVMVMVDEPKGNKKSYYYATAGWVAAPAMKRIVTSMASVMGMPADKYTPDQDISHALDKYIHDPKAKKGKRLVSY